MKNDSSKKKKKKIFICETEGYIRFYVSVYKESKYPQKKKFPFLLEYDQNTQIK